jgi:hypothetical protein
MPDIDQRSWADLVSMLAADPDLERQFLSDLADAARARTAARKAG